MNGKVISIAVAATALVLVGCSSSDDNPPGFQPSELIVGESDTGVAADDIDTLELRRNAATLSSSSLGLNINELLGVGFATSDEGTPVNPNGMNVTTVGDNVENGDMLDDDVESLMNTSLALDSNVATVTREGNIITIDPDENELCQEQVLGDMVDNNAACVAVYQDLLVVLDARSEDTGVVTYQFQQEPVLLIGYSPDGGSYEINIGGLKTLLEAAADEDPETTVDLPDTFSGAVRVTAMVDDDSGVAAAGSISLAVTQPINIVDTDGDANFSLGNSELLKVSSDAQGNTRIDSTYGALSASFLSQLDDEDPDSMDVVALMMSGFTSQLSINEDADVATLTNTGSVLSIAINSGEAVNLSVSNYGATLTPDSLTIDQGLTLGASLTSVVGELSDGFNNAQFDVSMPTGTVLEEDSSGAARVAAGMFSYSLNASTSEGPITSSFAASAGECFESGGDDDDDPVFFGETVVDEDDDDEVLVKVDCGAF